MSIQLTCPHCGIRPVEEWLYGEWPRPPEHLTDPNEIDIDRAFMITNTHGPKDERWFHAAGCRRWYTIHRDTTKDV